MEENEAMRRLLRGLLEGLPAAISECQDGAQALAMCAEVQPDWVLLDLHLAGIDSFAATRQIVAAGRPVRVLLLGEEDDVRWRDLAEKAGACGYALKQNLIDVPGLLT